MSLPDDIEEVLGEGEACLLEPRDEYDGCVIGIGYRFNSGPLAVYSIPRVLGVLEGMGMDEEGAREFFEKKMIGAWIGEGTPLFVHLFGE